MAQILSLLSLFLLFSLLTSALSQSSDRPTVYELLPKYGLPQGLLPATVTSYTLNDDGSFVLELSATCYIQFDYLVYYDKTISGKLSYGAITSLKGIQVQRFLFWFDVDEIKVDVPPSDSIYFQVGLINKKLDLDQFKTVHSCRDAKLGQCGSGFGSWPRALKLPTPLEDEVQMLITE